MDAFNQSTLRRTHEYYRISGLPRRTWTDTQMRQCADYYTRTLRTSDGTMTLRSLQGVALHETIQCGGLFGPISVGGGKTLLSLLAARVVNAQLPLLILPAALIEDTERKRGALMLHWQIPRNIKMVSYDALGRDGQVDFIEGYCPDLIIADEAHRLKNLRAGVTRRVARYMAAKPSTRFIAISGTLMKSNLEDFAHILEWCLKDGAPIPLEKGERMEWSEALGTNTNPMRRVKPGPLLSPEFGTQPIDIDADLTASARRAFRRRLRDTPGVVASSEDEIGNSLLIQARDYRPNQATEANFTRLRDEWETPDGWTLCQATAAWMCARQLALGFHYIWDPRPPPEWMEARKVWAKFVRDVISHSKHLDTEKTVRDAALRGEISAHALTPWLRIEPTFQVHQRMVWHDDTVLDLCAKWAREPGIIWTEHAFFGRELARRTGLEYFGEKGLTEQGKYIEQAMPGTSVIASIDANSTGRNLQGLWSRNLVTSPPSSALGWEQLIGRTHRHGQLADTVTVDVLLGCLEHYDAIEKSIANAHETFQLMGASQKLLVADIVIPSAPVVLGWAKLTKRFDKEVSE